MRMHIKTLIICADCPSTSWIGSLVTSLFLLWVFSNILNWISVSSQGCYWSIFEIHPLLIIILKTSLILNFAVLVTIVGRRRINKTIFHLINFWIKIFKLRKIFPLFLHFFIQGLNSFLHGSIDLTLIYHRNWHLIYLFVIILRHLFESYFIIISLIKFSSIIAHLIFLHLIWSLGWIILLKLFLLFY
jgi:hypothetical protein